MSTNVIPISCMLPLLDPYLPKCPEPLMIQTLITVLKEFFGETQAWTCELDRIMVKEDQPLYDLDQPSYARIDTIKSATMDGRELRPVLDYTMPSKCSIRLTHVPQADTVDDAEEAGELEDDGLFVEVVLVPWRDSRKCVVPSDLFDDWQEVWAAGVKAELMGMAGKPWSDARGAKDNRIAFFEGKNAAKFDQARGGLNVELTMRVTPGYEFE